jgi:hypothetical protein
MEYFKHKMSEHIFVATDGGASERFSIIRVYTFDFNTALSFDSSSTSYRESIEENYDACSREEFLEAYCKALEVIIKRTDADKL